MGIKDFFNIKVGDETFMNSCNSVELSDLSGKTIAIDGNLILWKSMAAIKNPLKDNEGNITTHINVALSKILLMAKHNINQIWVFDNPAISERKKATVQKRNESRKKYNSIEMKSQYFHDIMTVLRYLGIVYIIVPRDVEAEQFAAWMTRGHHEYLCDYVLTTDPDTILFKGNMLRQYTTGRGRSKKDHLCTIDYEDFMEHNDLSHEELEKIAAILGHDFHDGIRGIGKLTVYQKVKYGYDLPDECINALEQFRMEPDNYIGLEETHKYEINIEELKKYLYNRAFNVDRLEERLNNYEKNYTTFL